MGAYVCLKLSLLLLTAPGPSEMYSEEMRLDDLDLVDLAECGVEMFSEEVLRG